MEEQIISIQNLTQNKTFSFEEAEDLISLLNLISGKTKRELNLLNSQLQFIKKDTEKAQAIQTKINIQLQGWSDKVRRLGAIPISLCKVQIMGDKEKYFWEYPEKKLFIN